MESPFGGKKVEYSEDQKFVIQARDRTTKKVEVLTSPLSLSDAQEWKPSYWNKKLYRYFKIAKAK
jgi:hypothetical protein